MIRYNFNRDSVKWKEADDTLSSFAEMSLHCGPWLYTDVEI